MSRPLPTLRAVGSLAVIAALAALAVVGCATKTVAPPPAETPPAASSATGAVQRFAWAMNHRDAGVVRDLLTDDFVFLSAGVDSAGNGGPSRDRTWLSAALAAMLDSSSSVSLVLDQNLIAFPDSRPGRTPKFHKQIRTSIQLNVRDSMLIEVSGNALFFAVRGDSAAIPQEMRDRGVKADSTTWWLERLEDETLGEERTPTATDPSTKVTLSLVLEYFFSLLAH